MTSLFSPILCKAGLFAFHLIVVISIIVTNLTWIFKKNKGDFRKLARLFYVNHVGIVGYSGEWIISMSDNAASLEVSSLIVEGAMWI